MRLTMILVCFLLATPSAWAFNFQEYVKRKAAGSVTLSKVGGVVRVTYTDFDPATGTATTPRVEELTLATIQAERARLQAQATDLQTLITDIQALP